MSSTILPLHTAAAQLCPPTCGPAAMRAANPTTGALRSSVRRRWTAGRPRRAWSGANVGAARAGGADRGRTQRRLDISAQRAVTALREPGNTITGPCIFQITEFPGKRGGISDNNTVFASPIGISSCNQVKCSKVSIYQLFFLLYKKFTETSTFFSVMQRKIKKSFLSNILFRLLWQVLRLEFVILLNENISSPPVFVTILSSFVDIILIIGYISPFGYVKILLFKNVAGSKPQVKYGVRSPNYCSAKADDISL